MSSDKRDFSDFRGFPGYISDVGEYIGWYIFPAIYSVDTMGRNRTWRIIIRLVAIDGKPERGSINWDRSVDTVIPLEDKHLDNNPVDIPENAVAQMWTEQGIVDNAHKVTVSIPTYITKGKNIGKKNATTMFTQALISARSKYLKKMTESSDRKNTKRYFPVAVHNYATDPCDDTKKLRMPAAVQRKLDGGRAVAYYDESTDMPVLYSRKLKDLSGNEHIVEVLKPFLVIASKKYPGLYLDGEIYKHGLSLQVISGIMRRDKESVDEKTLEYHIFDVFFPTGTAHTKGLPYIERKKILDDIFTIALQHKSNSKFLVKVKTHIVNSVAEETALYKKFLKEKYEGSIIRNLDAPYEFGINKEIRTYQIRKRKPRHSDEYEIVGYTEGSQGKDKGAIIWILKTPCDKKKKIESIEFTSTPVGIDYAERYKLFKEMTPEIFADNYKGKQMTVEYDELSADGVPLRAKAKNIRTIN